ncbi:MAG: hypothetical protein J5472_04385 [Clostridia bacterium]|nr:hypothetical protein [Clostridia bacterium]
MNQDVYTMDRYGEKPPFSSFLPGIAGEKGIPVWCYYNNRGQAVCSFGIQDKDHAIMEFSPAHVAYQNVQRTGFRTFLKTASGVEEAFSDGSASMDIRPNGLTLRWENARFRVEAAYFVVPECRVGALARRLTVTNLGPAADVGILDGMPALVPFGVGQDSLKNMTQLSKAWMQAEDAETGLPYYRVRASMEDSAIVTAIEGGNFALGLTADGRRLPVTVNPETVFDYDTALEKPLGFEREDFALRARREVTQIIFPCAFFLWEGRLATGETVRINELYGQADGKGRARAFASQALTDAWFDEKQARADALSAALTGVMGGRTASPVFDAYSCQSYLDNLLRGGEPIRFTHGEKQNIFYLYSRKHGDPEREYNYFVMSPEYYSQGNGNFRDVCQNRRCDPLFHPWVGDGSIRLFFSLLQADGYNPLVIDRMTFRCADVDGALERIAPENREEAEALLRGEFTPGRLAMAAETWRYARGGADEFVRAVLADADAEPNATFQEGYWTDHWTYSLDLIESYLAVWPEKQRQLLFGKADYPWWESRAFVLPREKRIEETPAGLRQTRFLDTRRKLLTQNKWMREEYGKGKRAQSTLMEKMVLLCAVKYATLDETGAGIEMEGGKPGWYDALNGLPALFGSSVAEGCELKRLLAFTAAALEENPGETVHLYDEMAHLLTVLACLPEDPRERWQQANGLREAYRESTAEGVSGGKTALSAAETASILRGMEKRLGADLKNAVERCGGICPTYFMYPDGKAEPLPLFLEGPVRWLKTDVPAEEKAVMADRVRESGLYDRKLNMYKVNASLENLTYAAGRTRAFTPGWLENESIWLHMEYKYLLELLRSGLYSRYEDAFCAAAVPFLDPDTYGRSPYENVSFIASSANPNPAYHGRGFVARLSGSTVEFLSLWQGMMFGFTPFAVKDGALSLSLSPMLPARLIPENGVVEAVLLGQCLVRYHIPGSGSLIPGQYAIEKYVLDGAEYPGPALPAEAAERVRSGAAKEMDVYISR